MGVAIEAEPDVANDVAYRRLAEQRDRAITLPGLVPCEICPRFPIDRFAFGDVAEKRIPSSAEKVAEDLDVLPRLDDRRHRAAGVIESGYLQCLIEPQP